MKSLSIAAIVVGVSTLIWLLVDSISSDALSMALGVLFGMVATIPPILLANAAYERRARDAAYSQPPQRTVVYLREVQPAAPRRIEPNYIDLIEDKHR